MEGWGTPIPRALGRWRLEGQFKNSFDLAGCNDNIPIINPALGRWKPDGQGFKSSWGYRETNQTDKVNIKYMFLEFFSSISGLSPWQQKVSSFF